MGRKRNSSAAQASAENSILVRCFQRVRVHITYRPGSMPKKYSKTTPRSRRRLGVSRRARLRTRLRLGTGRFAVTETHNPFGNSHTIILYRHPAKIAIPDFPKVLVDCISKLLHLLPIQRFNAMNTKRKEISGIITISAAIKREVASWLLHLRRWA